MARGRRYLHFARASRHEFLQTKKASPVIASPRENKGAVWLGGLFFSSPVRVLVRRNKYVHVVVLLLVEVGFFNFLRMLLNFAPPLSGREGNLGPLRTAVIACPHSLPFLSFVTDFTATFYARRRRQTSFF